MSTLMTQEAPNWLLNSTKNINYDTEIDTYRYDPNGNTISRITETFSPIGINPATGSFGGDGWDINEYNGFNQLIKTSSDGVEVDYVYKPNGLRLSKTENGTKTTLIWDGDNIAAELSGNSVALTKSK